jgi:hypothetical protein
VIEPSRAVLLSYASQDAAVANAVVVALERQRLECWIAPRHVTPGAFYVDGIVRAVDATKAIALLLLQSAAAFRPVLGEVERSAE